MGDLRIQRILYIQKEGGGRAIPTTAKIMVFLSYISSRNEKTGLAAVKCTTVDPRIKRVLYRRKGGGGQFRRQQISCSGNEKTGLAGVKCTAGDLRIKRV